jgi:hypothetical protein
VADLQGVSSDHQEENTMTEAMEIASNYIATWNATDAAERERLLANHWTRDASYVDPLMAAGSAAELSGMIGAVHDRFPGFRFSLISKPDGHNDWIRFSWGLGPEGADPIIEGSDVVRVDSGRMKSVVGFLDKVPATA